MLVDFHDVGDDRTDTLDSCGTGRCRAGTDIVDETTKTGDNEPAPELLPGGDEGPRKDRQRIDPPERRALDKALAKRLDRLKQDPWLPNVTVIIDIDSGESFDLLPVREHWIFAGNTKTKAAKFVAQFTAFGQQTDTSTFRAYVLRPKLRKGNPGELAETINRVSADVGKVISKAKQDGLARPIAVFIHVRYDVGFDLWDVHLHCVFDVVSEHSEQFFGRLCSNFSTPKEIVLEKDIGSWVNYSAGWVVDHRDIAEWPAHAVKEFWKIKAVQLLRKGGAFASFCKTLRGKSLRWDQGRVVIEDTPVKAPRKTASHPSRAPNQRGYAVLRIGGQTRRCAIVKRPRRRRRNTDSTARQYSPAMSFVRERMESTTTTGSIPTMPLSRPATSIVEPSGRQSIAMRSRFRRQERLWRTVWPYGNPACLPRPVRRRLATYLPAPS